MGVLNFSPTTKITGINIIDGHLYWTDGINEPKKLEIDRWKQPDVTSTRGLTLINEVGFDQSDVTVIRQHPTTPITLRLTPYTPTDDQPDPPFEKIFPRFSYRWKYEDGQYSPYAPFTQAAFIPKDRMVTSTTTPGSAIENYQAGFNTTLFNNVGTITLGDIPKGPSNVIEVELLYTESISATIYVLDVLEIPAGQRGQDFVLTTDYRDRLAGNYTSGEFLSSFPGINDYILPPLEYTLSSRKIYRGLPPNQLTRHYDDVPRRAVAQEITANRLLYANYTQDFDHPQPYVGLEVNTVPAESFPYLHPETFSEYPAIITGSARETVRTNLIDNSNTDGLSVKTGRTYELGVVYIDEYGRQGTMLQAGSFVGDDGVVVEADGFRMPFAVPNRAALVAKITTEAPDWADSYRYFIKDVSQDHHNLVAYNIYNEGDYTDDGADHVWLEFNSSDRNKVQEGTLLVLKRRGLVQPSTKERFLIQDIQNEAPQEVENQIRVDSLENPIDPATITIMGNQAVGDTLIEYDDTTPSPLGIGRITGGIFEFMGVTYTVITNNSSEAGIRPALQHEIPDNTVITVNPDLSEGSLNGRTDGRFWVRIRRPDALTEARNARLRYNDDGSLDTASSFLELLGWFFETEPDAGESQLDLFWESSNTFCVCTDHGWPNKIDWYNCVAEYNQNLFNDAPSPTLTGGIYLESQRINDQFNSVQLVKGVRVNVPTNRIQEQNREYGLIWSGIYNSRTGINRLNEFIEADGIVKELEPNYGSIQKLHTRDTNVIAFAEDKVFRILADKDLLFNADGGGNVSASNQVLGQTTPFVGEYGISSNPESFASYGHNVYFSDAKRGVVCQLTPGNGQIFEISTRGMDDFFRDRLFSADQIIGMHDDYSDSYVISVQGYDPDDPIIDPDDSFPDETGETTLRYEISTEGWPSRLSYIPEAGLTLNNKFYTWKLGKMWMHNSNTVNRNNFYGEQYNSEVEVIFNDNPSAVKEWLTIGYEGTPDWTVIGLDTESEDTALTSTWDFVSKEGKYFAPIVGQEDIYGITGIQPDGTFITEPTGETKDTSGIKGFYNVVRLQNEETTKQELFSINTENYISSN